MRIKSYLLSLGWFLSFSVFAKEKCTIEVKSVIPMSNGGWSLETKVRAGVYISEVSTWQDCYRLALDAAKKLVDKFPVELGGTKDQPEIIRAQAYLFVNWTFNDGYIFDSSGKVTKYTDDDNFQLGDRRKLENGSFFE